MDVYDEDYSYFMDLVNSTSKNENQTYITNPSYVVDGIVRLCPKTNVVHFGAKYLPPFFYINFIISSLFSVGFYSSILFLTLMTFDRYLAVVHAVTAAKQRRKAYAISSSVVVWVVSLASSVKELILHDTHSDPKYGELCEDLGYDQNSVKWSEVKWKLFGYYQQFIMFFMIPLAIVLYCYICITVRVLSTRMREKCRAVKLIFVIVLTFFICWTPYNVVILLQALEMSYSADCPSDVLDYAHFITRNLAFLYCCISPVFYTFVGKKFQNHFRKLLARHIPCLKSFVLTTDTRSQTSKTTSCKNPYMLTDKTSVRMLQSVS